MQHSKGKLMEFIQQFMQDESGQDLIEYALVAGLIGLGCVAAMTALSTKIATAFNSIGSQLASAV